MLGKYFHMARLWCCSNILSKQTNLTFSLSKSTVNMHRFLLCWLYIFCHHLHTLFEKYNLKKQTSDVKGSTKVLCLNVIYVWYMWHMWKYVMYVICDMSNATMFGRNYCNSVVALHGIESNGCTSDCNWSCLYFNL